MVSGQDTRDALSTGKCRENKDPSPTPSLDQSPPPVPWDQKYGLPLKQRPDCFLFSSLGAPGTAHAGAL